MLATLRRGTAKWPTGRESHRRHVVRDRTGQGLPAAVPGAVPTTDTHAALCYLTPPAPTTVWHGESCPGPCSLGISIKNQLLPPSLGKSLPRSRSRRTHAYRAPHDGSASASTGPRLSTLSTLWQRHVTRGTRHTLRQATGAPTPRTGPSSCVLGVSTPMPSHQPGLGTPRRSNIQRPARLQQKKVRLPPQELPRHTRPGVIGASL